MIITTITRTYNDTITRQSPPFSVPELSESPYCHTVPLTYILILSHKLCLRLPRKFLPPVLCFKIELLPRYYHCSISTNNAFVVNVDILHVFPILERDLIA